MKSLIKMLSFDRQVIAEVKKINADPAYLYNLLNAGKITMQEYLIAVKK